MSNTSKQSGIIYYKREITSDFPGIPLFKVFFLTNFFEILYLLRKALYNDSCMRDTHVLKETHWLIIMDILEGITFV